tara:strand:+ start:786 stop:1331 length:546 start_codon:yes stop_codon:yes gene_type:complete
MAQTDASLLSDGGERAFAVLFRRHYPAVLAYSFGVAADSGSAEDVASRALELLWQKRSSVRLVGDSALPWLLLTAKNHARNDVRARVREREKIRRAALETADPFPDSELLSLRQEAATYLAALLDGLSPQDREVFDYCIVDGLSYADAAKKIGATPGAVGNRLSRVRGALRKQLAPLREES